MALIKLVFIYMYICVCVTFSLLVAHASFTLIRRIAPMGWIVMIFVEAATR